MSRVIRAIIASNIELRLECDPQGLPFSSEETEARYIEYCEALEALRYLFKLDFRLIK